MTRVIEWRESEVGEISMMDIVYIAITVALFGLSLGLVRLCDRV
jgi:hypothetical protein